MALAVMTIPSVLFLVRAIKITGSDGAHPEKTGVAEMIVVLPWLALMVMCIGTSIYCIVYGLTNGKSSELSELIIHFGGVLAGKYYLPVIGITALICGIIALAEKKVKRFAVDMLFTAVFGAIWWLCRTGCIIRLWRVWEERP